MLDLNVFSSEHSSNSLNAVGHASLQGPSSSEPSHISGPTSAALPGQATSCFGCISSANVHPCKEMHPPEKRIWQSRFCSRKWKWSNNWTNGPVSQVCWSSLSLTQFPHGEGAALSPSPQTVFTHPKGPSMQGHSSFLGPVWAPCQSWAATAKAGTGACTNFCSCASGFPQGNQLIIHWLDSLQAVWSPLSFS